ncbi:hypothetical protein [Streptomyces sp. A30]|uniref:hypothetical protein n=1 Tax=Streptomyces sp. A30 TaxID=2789273 RepID=UPI003980B1FE
MLRSGERRLSAGQRLARWNAREQALIATDSHRVPPLALPPLADDAVAGAKTSEATSLVGAAGSHGRGLGERRQPRHQALHPRLPGLLPLPLASAPFTAGVKDISDVL